MAELCVEFQGMPPVYIKQSALIGIPGAVYDCSLALAGYVIDELLPPDAAVEVGAAPPAAPAPPPPPPP
eukprot:CAMPEP_0197579616 /NCGR_PEP_ID=MMETSP1326-20131121/3595_1 /TAXON_ID=1155430 /ORGANISM="Genus nov. species nov., Strain RCC2288" /LENGTH=68 /DNA_ID=CAMNT_0043143143 /DNA_START=108 /DNA_END=311 /DNA_ORIENTATION=+